MRLVLYGDSVNLKRFVLIVVVPIACLAAAVFVFAPPSVVWISLLVLLGLPFALLSIDRPEIPFYLLMFILFSNLDVYAPIRLYRIVILLVLASFALALVNGRRIATHHPLLFTLLAALLIISLQSLAVAREYHVAVRGLVHFYKVLAGVLIASQFVRDRREFKRFLLIAALGILLSDFLPFILRPPTRLGSLSMLWDMGVVRYEGFVFEPNTFAVFQLFLIPILVFFIGLYRKPAAARPLLMFAILASISVLILSFSRGGFIGLVVLVLTLIVVERRNRALLLFGLALIAIGVIATPALYWERVASLFDFVAKGSDDYALTTRIGTMRAALRIGLANPLLGVGIDNFLYSASYYIPFRLTVHNSYLLVFAELGAVAFTLLCGIIGYGFMIVRRMIARRDDPEGAAIGRALLMQQVAVLIGAFFIPLAFDMIFWFTLLMPAIAEYAYRSGGAAALDGSRAQSVGR